MKLLLGETRDLRELEDHICVYSCPGTVIRDEPYKPNRIMHCRHTYGQKSARPSKRPE